MTVRQRDVADVSTGCAGYNAAMSAALEKRWYQLTLRRILFWHLPYAGIMASLSLEIMAVQIPRNPFDPFGIIQQVIEAIVIGFLVQLGILVTLVWLLAPGVVHVGARVWRRLRHGPQAHV